MKKDKDLTPTASRLVEMAKERHDKVMVDAVQAEKAHKKRVADLGEKERELKAEIKTAKDLLEKMTVEFEILEKKKKGTITAEAERNNLLDADLKSGKITIKEFVKLKTETPEDQEEEDSGEVEEKIPDPLEEAGDLVRAKGEEIIRIEHELYDIQTSIFNLITQPVQSLRISYRSLGEMMDYQMEGLLKEGSNSRCLLSQKKNELSLIEHGMSVSSAGYKWSALTLKDAYRLRLDPIFPKQHIASLIEQLADIEPGENVRISIVYRQPGSHWPGSPVTVYEELPAPPPTKSRFKSIPMTTED